MGFRFLNKIVFKVAGLAILGFTIGLAFQNCSTQFSSGSPEAQASLNTPNRVIDDSDDGTGAVETSELKIELYATAALQEDCSVSGENYQFEILNASEDITMCTEYALDMPEGHPRRQESYKCNDININDKLVPPSSAWEYSAKERKWSYRALTNTVEQMPGDYRLYVRSGSSAAKSALLKVRRSGYANCGSQTARYVVPEPMTPPSSGGGGAVVPTPSPSPSPVVNGTTCNPPGTKIIRVTTQWPEKSFGRKDYPMIKENEIYVFAVKTPNDLVNRLNGAFVTTRLSATRGGVVTSVSECPGDIDPISKVGGCFEYSSETTTIDVIINSNSNEKKRQSLCYLKPNTQYYVSVFVSTENSYTEYDGSGKLIKILPPTSSCNQAGWCGLSFFAN